jgi:hypothetical protein
VVAKTYLMFYPCLHILQKPAALLGITDSIDSNIHGGWHNKGEESVRSMGERVNFSISRLCNATNFFLETYHYCRWALQGVLKGHWHWIVRHSKGRDSHGLL